MVMLRQLADWKNPASMGNKFRARRFARFERLAGALPRPLHVLDVGGTNLYWELRGWAGRDDVQITLLNLEAESKKHRNIDPVAGDATDMRDFADASFDIAFSNSVIEHLFTREKQFAMAKEVQRVGRTYWVQTPNFWFPMEPHFHVPGWQWMPERMRVGLIRRYACGWRGPCPDPDQARDLVREVRLMSRRELSQAFPSATIEPEWFGGLVKSWIVTGGFAASC